MATQVFCGSAACSHVTVAALAVVEEVELVEEVVVLVGRSQVLPVQLVAIQLCCLEYWSEA